MVRLPVVNSDDGTWGTLLRAYIKQQHYNDPTDVDAPDNGRHQNVYIMPGTAAAGTAPLKFQSGPVLSTPEAGAVEYNGGFYMTPSNGTRYAVSLRDTYGNVNSPNNNSGISIYSTASANISLISAGAASNFFQMFTGGGTQKLTLPVTTSGFATGISYMVQNNGSGTLEVLASDNSHVYTLGDHDYAEITCISTSSTSSTAWFVNQFNVGAVDGKDVTFNNTFTFSGTDGTAFTYPNASDTVVGTVASQTLASKTIMDPKIGYDIYDLNGNKIFGLSGQTNAVNYIYLANAPAGAGPYFNAAGPGGANVNIGFAPQNAGNFYYYQPSGSTMTFQTDGQAAAIDLNITTKGGGRLKANGVDVLNSASYAPSTKTGNYSIVTTDHTAVYFADATSGAVTITLPAANTVNGYRFDIKRIDSSGNQVLVNTAGGTIDGASSLTLDLQYTSITVVSNGTNWYIL